MSGPSNGAGVPDGDRPGGRATPGSARREQLLTELSAELRAVREQQRRDVARLGALVADNADLLAQVLPRVSQLDGAVAELADRVGPPGPGGAAAAAGVDWPSLSAEAAAAEWETLTGWVATVLGPFYEVTRAQLPDCWPLHPPAVIELVWLRRAYTAAHAPDASPTAVGEWHVRWRRDALANIKTAIDETWCRPGEHWVHRNDRPAGPREGARPDYRSPPGRRPDPADIRYGRGTEITSPAHWDEAYRTAMVADLARRREREVAAGAE